MLFEKKIHGLKTDLDSNDVTLIKSADDSMWPLLENCHLGLTVIKRDI